MSRRPPNPGAERAAQNQQTLKTLVKLESNKSCADCKRNKHPRWASWNLGIFLCIRCSGIHRGMGTHISRVKSVDLDAWTDEQMQNMIRWGNGRANKYWEAKLAPGHVPQETKMENFIRTKYDSKRWVMDGGMPDPSTLDTEPDDELPLNVVQEKAKMGHARQVSTNVPPPQARSTNPDIDLFGDSVGAPPAPKATAASTSSSNAPPTPPKSQPAAVKQQKTSESLLGFDFFGEPPSNSRPTSSSTAASAGSMSTQSRPDLKQSILSLYSSSSRSATPNQQQQQQATSTGVSSQSPRTGFGNLESDFAGLNFGSAQSGQRQSPAPSNPVASPPVQTFSPPPQQAFSPPPQQTFSPPAQQSFGGGFFDSKPSGSTIPTKSSTPGTGGQPATQQRSLSSSSGFGGFESTTSPGAGYSSAPKSNPLGDLDFSSPAVFSPTKSPSPAFPSQQQNSPFNISSPQKPPQATPAAKAPSPATTSAGLMNMDPWGSSDVWSSSASTTTATAAATAPAPGPKAAPTISAAADDWGWGGETKSGGFGSTSARSAQITADEDFGGWESSTIPSPAQDSKPAGFAFASQQSSSAASTSTSKPISFPANNEDLFSNVWE